MNRSTASAATLTLALLAGGALQSAPSAASPELDALRAQVSQLEQQLQALSRQLEVRERSPTPAALVTADERGFLLASADQAHALRLRGLLQLDSRLYFRDGGGLPNNTFVLRRARVISEGRFAHTYGFQFFTDFGGGAVAIQDANFTVRLTPTHQLKFGKFKTPVGLEMLQSDATTFFAERSLATNLVPNRDLGVQVSGSFFHGTLDYQAGVFNGLGDGASTTNSDFDNEKDWVGRVIVAPFKHNSASPVRGLSFGIAGSLGREKGPAGRTAGYRTDGQQTFFSYTSSTIVDGRNSRLAPQLDFRCGTFGLVAEYVTSTINPRASAPGPTTELRNRAGQMSVGWVLTGEESSYHGVTPRSTFDWTADTWGAFEIVGRCARFAADDRAFPVFANAAANARTCRAIGLGLNWYLSKTTLLKLDGFHSSFGFSPLAPAQSTSQILRQDELSLISRCQLSF